MRVTFFGVRGSVPTPGPSTVRYGGNTVCVEVRLADGTLLVLDAGTGIRELGKRLLADDDRSPVHLFLTHGHWDHIIGLPFFGPLYRKDTRFLIHPFTARAQARARDPILFDGEHFPVRFADLPARIEQDEPVGGEFRVGSARVRGIALNHPGGATGFRIDDDGGASVCYLTDNELSAPSDVVTTPAELARFAAGAGLVIHDAQYLPPDMPAKRGWGHSQVHEVLDLARESETRAIVLHHHDPDRDDDALDRIGTDAADWARTAAPSLQTIVAREGLSIDLARG
jgi:phosphoribosyl 1,2-cyclic phosphodiesterase